MNQKSDRLILYQLNAHYMIFIKILLISFLLFSEKAYCRSLQPKTNTHLEQKEIENLLIENSKKLNKSLPVMIDSQTRLDTTFAAGMVMHYKCTLININSDQVDADLFHTELKSQLIKSLKAEKSAMFLVNNGVFIVYYYFDKNGVLITSIRFDAASFGME
ncbi:MAG: hypothetical protein NTZ08_14130 [Verrucomicrobia bacterium]|nr:hypothetical protein [Verrucomicrobiota bacterium]